MNPIIFIYINTNLIKLINDVLPFIQNIHPHQKTKSNSYKKQKNRSEPKKKKKKITPRHEKDENNFHSHPPMPLFECCAKMFLFRCCSLRKNVRKTIFGADPRAGRAIFFEK